MGRQIGHTKLATDLYNEKLNSVLIVPTINLKSNLKTLGTTDVFVHSQITKSMFRNRTRPNMVIVDNSFCLSKTKEKLLVDALSKRINSGEEFILVFLQ